MKKKIVLADDHGVVRKGLRSLINEMEGFDIIGEATDGEQALKMVKELSPDILITDISMPKLNGLELLDVIKSENLEVNVLILSMYEDEEYVLAAIEAGASGYVHKDADDDELLKAIENIGNGSVYYGNSIKNIMAKKIKQSKVYDAERSSALTSREQEILKLIVKGQSNKEIAVKLFISTRTVDTHRNNIMRKLKVRNAAELVRIAIQKRLCVVIKDIV